MVRVVLGLWYVIIIIVFVGWKYSSVSSENTMPTQHIADNKHTLIVRDVERSELHDRETLTASLILWGNLSFILAKWQ